MATIVSGTVPANEFALYETLAGNPDLEFEVERIVESGDEAVMPFVWVRGGDGESVESVLSDDPSVENLSLLAEFDDEQLYRMEWISRVDLVLQMLTNSEATITDAHGSGQRWTIRILYPTRESVSRTRDFCEANDLTFDVTVIRELEGEPAGRYGLTEEQYEALKTAYEGGYFHVPRESTLSDVAAELNVSQQALSERMRRAHEALIEDTVLIGSSNDD
ncbi:helix-turn-helix domain-containing protein [Halegenticoccus tardaugens]|uniref:helix-turn-helix domain-containing protein n=1 Tax=Halegenticoccus tardaugens TaxID=2071624 RepID=UPI00100B5077|nr:bacterio-opsin activator domain-containing protein [Halegenticoccus tardaugens]